MSFQTFQTIGSTGATILKASGTVWTGKNHGRGLLRARLEFVVVMDQAQWLWQHTGNSKATGRSRPQSIWSGCSGGWQVWIGRGRYISRIQWYQSQAKYRHDIIASSPLTTTLPLPPPSSPPTIAMPGCHSNPSRSPHHTASPHHRDSHNDCKSVPQHSPMFSLPLSNWEDHQHYQCDQNGCGSI